MMLKQNGSDCRINILLIYLFIMVAVCSSSPVHERARRGAGAGNCNGGRNTYQYFCYGTRTGDSGREADVQQCFDKLYNSPPEYHNGCFSDNQGRCRCTVDSSFILTWQQTFREARESLYQKCSGFTNDVMERYEGNMYLAATCD